MSIAAGLILECAKESETVAREAWKDFMEKSASNPSVAASVVAGLVSLTIREFREKGDLLTANTFSCHLIQRVNSEMMAWEQPPDRNEAL